MLFGLHLQAKNLTNAPYLKDVMLAVISPRKGLKWKRKVFILKRV